MRNKTYRRSVSMLCPTCGCSVYESEQAVDETVEIVKCASCGRKLTKDEIVSENSENINEHASDMGEEAKADIAKELRTSLKKTFRGNKNFRIK